MECHDTTTLWLRMFCMLPKRNTKTKKKFQVMQNKCIRFCLQVDKMSTISHKEFKDLNWLPAINRFEQCFISILFKFINDNCPYYLNGVFEFAPEGNISLRNNLNDLFEIQTPVKQPYLLWVLHFGIQSQKTDIKENR